MDACITAAANQTWNACRPKHDFLPDGSAVPVWPPAELLSSIAQDDTILVTSASCAYADLLTNWLKHIWDMQIKCFFVAAADEATAEFLADWMPKHSSQIPAKLVNQVSWRLKAAISWCSVSCFQVRIFSRFLAAGLCLLACCMQ